MFALSLFAVFAMAKLLVIFGRNLPWTPSLPFALFWQEIFFAAIAGWCLTKVDQRWRSAAWSCYGLLCIYAAMNVPMARALGTPLTWRMSHAAGGALSDSIRHYLTPTNFALISMVCATALLGPICFRKIPHRTQLALGLLTVPLTIAGAASASRIQTAGLDRNPVMAFVQSCFPHVQGASTAAVWRESGSQSSEGADLRELRGSLAGRNVMLIVLESTGARYLKVYGAAKDTMPNLSLLARDALVAENAYAVYPESIKGLFSYICSRYPAFDISAERLAPSADSSLVKTLRSNGYQTALFHSGRFMYLGMDSVVEPCGFETAEDAGAISGRFNSSFGVDEPSTVERILAWIDQAKRDAKDRRKFFIAYLPIAGHHPYDTPERGPFAVQSEQDRYLNALHYGDRSLGQLFDGLKERGLFTNTVFVIFGDHGEAFGQHAGNFAHTLFLYEENVHVPFLVAAPGKLTEQTRVTRPLSLIDMAPTLLDLLGIASPVSFQGESWLSPATRLSLFYTDYSLPLVGLRDGPWKFIGELGTARNQLYDLRHDPNEKTNLSGAFPTKVAAYRQRLEQWSAAQKQLFSRQ